MRRIFKYTVRVGEEIPRHIPKDATILTVAAQFADVIDEVQIWVEVDDASPEVERTFVVIGTGHPIPETTNEFRYDYLGTAIVGGGSLVWHLYEKVTRDLIAEISQSLTKAFGG